MAKFRPMVPVTEILSDERLNPRAIRVLLALYQFSDKNGECRPKRETLAQMCRLHIVCISQATAELVKLGWLTKNGSGGKSAATRYRLHVPAHLQSSPETVADFATVTAPETVAYFATVTKPRKKRQTVADFANQTVADSATGKEHTNEHTILTPVEEDSAFKVKAEESEYAHRAEKFAPTQTAAEPTEPTPPSQPEPLPWEQQDDDDDVPPWEREQPQQHEQHDDEPLFALKPTPAEKPKKQKPLTQKQAKKLGLACVVPMPAEVDPQHWHDWLAYRQKKGKPVTLSAWQGFLRDAKICNFTVAQAVQVCAEKCWLSLPVEKYTQPQNGWQQTNNRAPALSFRAQDEEMARQEILHSCPALAAKPRGGEVIDVATRPLRVLQFGN